MKDLREKTGCVSRAYHSYFEGYSEYKELDEKGVLRIKRVYTGIWYVPEQSPKKRTVYKIIYTCFLVISLALLIFLASRDSQANNTAYCVAPQVVAIVGIAWTGIGLGSYLTAPARQTIGTLKHSSGRVKTGAIIAGIGFITSAIVNLVFMLTNLETEMVPGSILRSIGYLAGAALMITISVLERNIFYKQETDNENVPKTAVIIQ